MLSILDSWYKLQSNPKLKNVIIGSLAYKLDTWNKFGITTAWKFIFKLFQMHDLNIQNLEDESKDEDHA